MLRWMPDAELRELRMLRIELLLQTDTSSAERVRRRSEDPSARSLDFDRLRLRRLILWLLLEREEDMEDLEEIEDRDCES